MTTKSLTASQRTHIYLEGNNFGGFMSYFVHRYLVNNSHSNISVQAYYEMAVKCEAVLCMRARLVV